MNKLIKYGVLIAAISLGSLFAIQLTKYYLGIAIVFVTAIITVHYAMKRDQAVFLVIASLLLLQLGISFSLPLKEYLLILSLLLLVLGIIKNEKNKHNRNATTSNSSSVHRHSSRKHD